eukprot:CAMPEP_0177447392 /NCGR_PEP_ID=MMETSP0369-20130122/7603_1 /TAXON_ID=447022 ORGANISM="Scrippsiella hangoei-like, Strain SHHI-4" /NCGR_SAMPLE_ID=MMETSP0369 /ASSEMBLY_ACC=CAM_ASM_000364 /LENGTH=304 /DNA_ID=CAMNT_0018919701 /DNA_START=104 /DNA_END=1015 /DNA_ORIENTATION=-
MLTMRMQQVIMWRQLWPLLLALSVLPRVEAVAVLHASVSAPPALDRRRPHDAAAVPTDSMLPRRPVNLLAGRARAAENTVPSSRGTAETSQSLALAAAIAKDRSSVSNVTLSSVAVEWQLNFAAAEDAAAAAAATAEGTVAAAAAAAPQQPQQPRPPQVQQPLVQQHQFQERMQQTEPLSRTVAGFAAAVSGRWQTIVHLFEAAVAVTPPTAEPPVDTQRERSSSTTGIDTVTDQLTRKRNWEFLGLPKLFWALVASMLAMGGFVLCIPWVLHVAVAGAQCRRQAEGWNARQINSHGVKADARA